jgi:predicted dehydrogenase
VTEPRIKVGLVGCGQIADAHLQQIRHLSCAELVAVCDLEPLLARQAAERFEVPGQFTSIEQMLDHARPDVVHLTTPVQTHAPLTIQLLESGVHVYVEKPFTVDATEARAVIDVAERTGRLVCLGHDQLFDPTWLEACDLVASGAIGSVQHVESVLGYPIDGPFGKLVASDPDHWVRRLPGGLFQNTISHPLYRITEFLPDSDPQLWATWFNKTRGVPFPTELRAHFRGENVTGSLLFASTIEPRYRTTRIYGSQAGIEIDLESQIIRFDRQTRLPGAFSKVEAPLRLLGEAMRNVRRGFGRFLRAEGHYFSGMQELFRRFYGAILDGTELPVSYDEALRVTGLMDCMFEQCRPADEERNAGGVDVDLTRSNAPRWNARQDALRPVGSAGRVD